MTSTHFLLLHFTRNSRTTARDARTTAGRGNGCPRRGRGVSSRPRIPAAGAPRQKFPLTCVRNLGYGGRRFRRRQAVPRQWCLKAMAPRSFSLRALFLWSNRRRTEMSELESKHYLMNGSETLPDAREALEWAAETRVSMVDLKFCDLLGTWQHMTLPLRGLRRVGVRGGPRLRRLLDPRLAGDLGVGHAADAAIRARRSSTRHRGADALARLRDRRPDHAARPTRATRARSRGAPRSTCARPGSRTRASSAPSASSSSSTRSATTSARTARTTRSTPREGYWNSGKPGPRLHGRARRRATSRRRRTTRCTTSAPRWC